MPRPANNAKKAGAIESFRFFFAGERPPGPPPKPFWLTYTGLDVVSVPGLGLFQNGTTAEVDAKVAARFREAPGWTVRERALAPQTEEETEDGDRRGDEGGDPGDAQARAGHDGEAAPGGA